MIEDQWEPNPIYEGYQPSRNKGYQPHSPKADRNGNKPDAAKDVLRNPPKDDYSGIQPPRVENPKPPKP